MTARLRARALSAAVFMLCLFVGLIGANVASARVIDCNVTASETQVISSARNMTCRAASRDLRRYRGHITSSFHTPGGFRCRQVSGQRLYGQWRCVNGSRAYRFDFLD